ncbi:PREDICTED: serine/arginine repetitive matrix protein 1-like isoform X1 [Calidris pugnax]|uniref:serine/arginine repetitive matrix protein 1-like isoform X1 n=1 Tax=Calidris pugnax TaxID=198806 RepID=UPI00071CD9E3|nr:PREDICTED: serine/arginine repetitive matrix protein 1-like isoform X1 [Calidris pugnax]
MSFEEYLNYDQPQKKKVKRAVRASVSAGKEEQPRVDSSCSCQPSPSRKRSHEQRGEQEPPEAPEPKRTLLNVDIKLPEIPLPPIQARCSPLPAAESPPCPQKKRRGMLGRPIGLKWAAATQAGLFFALFPSYSTSSTSQRLPRQLKSQKGVSQAAGSIPRPRCFRALTPPESQGLLLSSLSQGSPTTLPPSVKRVVSLCCGLCRTDAPQSRSLARRDVTMSSLKIQKGSGGTGVSANSRTRSPEGPSPGGRCTSACTRHGSSGCSSWPRRSAQLRPTKIERPKPCFCTPRQRLLGTYDGDKRSLGLEEPCCQRRPQQNQSCVHPAPSPPVTPGNHQ